MYIVYIICECIYVMKCVADTWNIYRFSGHYDVTVHNLSVEHTAKWNNESVADVCVPMRESGAHEHTEWLHEWKYLARSGWYTIAYEYNPLMMAMMRYCPPSYLLHGMHEIFRPLFRKLLNCAYDATEMMLILVVRALNLFYPAALSLRARSPLASPQPIGPKDFQGLSKHTVFRWKF